MRDEPQQDQRMERSKRQLPPFAVWQARQLASRDLLYGAVSIAIMVVYFSKAIPQLCHEGVSFNAQHLQEAAVQQLKADHDSFLWRLVCGDLANPLEGVATALHEGRSVKTAAVARWLPGSAVLHLCAVLTVKAADITLRTTTTLMQAVSVCCFAGVLSRDPVHIVLAPLRFGLLIMLLVHVPCPNLAALAQRTRWRSNRHHSSLSAQHHGACSSSSSSIAGQGGSYSRNSNSSSLILWYHPRYYWEHPMLRNTVVILQRMPHLALVALTVGSPNSLYFAYTLRLSLWTSLGKYVHQGWMQYTQALPLRIHYAACLLEWALAYYTSLRVDAVYGADALAFAPNSGWFYLYHLVVSLLFVVVLPTVGVVHLEQSLRGRYEQLLLEQLRTLRSIDDSYSARAGRSVRGNKCGSSASSSRRSSAESSCSTDDAACNNAPSSRFGGSNDSGNGVRSTVSDSRRSSSEYVRGCQQAMEGSRNNFAGSYSAPQVVLDASMRNSTHPAVPPYVACRTQDSSNQQQPLGMAGAAAPAAAADLANAAVAAVAFPNDSLPPAFLADIHGSLNLAATAAPAGRSAAGAANQGTSGYRDVMPGMQYDIASLIGEQGAAAVYLAAAEAAARPAEQHLGVPYYNSMAQYLPLSIVVHADTLPDAMYPVLADSAATQVDAAGQHLFPMYMEAACVEAACTDMH